MCSRGETLKHERFRREKARDINYGNDRMVRDETGGKGRENGLEN
jgi:hypothetical protein